MLVPSSMATPSRSSAVPSVASARNCVSTVGRIFDGGWDLENKGNKEVVMLCSPVMVLANGSEWRLVIVQLK